MDEPAWLTGPLVLKGRSVLSELTGGIAKTPERLGFCGRDRIGAGIKPMPIQAVNEACERETGGNVKYRFDIDMAVLKTAA